MRAWSKAKEFLVLPLCILVGVSVSPSTTAVAQDTRFDVNDLAYLWPPPSSSAEVAELISADEVVANGQLWPAAAFELLLRNAQSTTVLSSAGTTSPIHFAQFAKEFAQPSVWKVVGFRVDPTAPSASPSAIAVFGSTPQIRMVLQPVTVGEDGVRVHDLAAHLAFSFTKGVEPPPTPGVFLRSIPDRDRFRSFLEDLRTLKSSLESAGLRTAGPLRVHPGLQARIPGFSAQLRDFLKRALSEDRLTDMAFMGLDPPEPWIFFAMRKAPDGSFIRVRSSSLGGQDAQMLTFRGGSPVMPSPSTLNLAPHGGVSTAALFKPDVVSLLTAPVFQSAPRPLHLDIPDVIANPRLSHVLNTDCVSCHTESTRRHNLSIPVGDGMFQFARPSGISGVDEAHLPQSRWNVRNFGWFQQGFQTAPTITMRTANEAAEAAEFVNREYFGHSTPERTSATASGNAPLPVPERTARPLTLVMKSKSRKDLVALKGLIEKLQSLPPERNPITIALTRLSTVHFARFIFLSDRQLAVITTYDGAFEDYIDAFVNAIGDVFDRLLVHIADAPPLPVSGHRKEFLEFVRKHDLAPIPPFYSAYPQLKVLDILTLQKQQAER